MSILIQMSHLNSIGGIETAIETVVRTFKGEDFKVVINSTSDGAQEQIKRLEKYAKVIIDRGRCMEHRADVALIFTPIVQEVPWDTINAKKVYQFVHSDIKGLMERFPQWQDFKWTPNPKITKVLAVSKTAQKALKEKQGVDSVVVPNIFNPENNKKVFLFMGRASAEKGLDKTLEMMQRFEKAGKEYVLLICSLVDPYGPLWPTINENPRIVYIPASIHNDIFYKCSDYCCVLSKTESWCYTAREALANKCAVIGSRIPEIEKVIKDGVNGYLVNDDLSDLDMDKIFDNVPKVDGYKEKVSPIWKDVLGGKI